MLGTVWPHKWLRPYHEDMLLVRVKPGAAEAMAAAMERPAQRRKANPGLANIARHHRDGTLRGLYHLGHTEARSSRSGPAHLVMKPVHAAERQRRDDVISSGCLLVHLHEPRHRERLNHDLANDPHIEHVERVPVRYIWAAPRGRVLQDVGALFPAVRMWNLRSIRLPQARARPDFREASRISVSILDSGVDQLHPALRGRIHEYVTDYPGLPPLSRRDVVGHGTHIAGVIGGSDDGELSGGGICRCRLTIYKIIDDRNYEEFAGIRLFTTNPALYIRALQRCLRRRPHVINLSLGGPAEPSTMERDLLFRLVVGESMVVVAMGNTSGGDTYAPFYPAALPGMIAVGAVGPSDAALAFSRRGKHITLTAPGIGIWSTLPTYSGKWGDRFEARGRGGMWRPIWRNRRFDAWLGTSAACAHVTGAVALLIAKRGRMAWHEVRNRLIRTADNTPGMRRKHFDRTFGGGRLNVARLLGG